jgi:crotonobetainyl-CoA:carnitine CoA-transferase CaiB-like acyl-CoA transferase
VRSIDQVFEDPQVIHRGMLQAVEHATLGRIPQVGHAQKFLAEPATIRLPPPLLGQHTREVLGSVLGWSSERVQQLIDDHVLHCEVPS